MNVTVVAGPQLWVLPGTLNQLANLIEPVAVFAALNFPVTLLITYSGLLPDFRFLTEKVPADETSIVPTAVMAACAPLYRLPGGVVWLGQPRLPYLNDSTLLPELETVKLTGARKPLTFAAEVNPVYLPAAVGCAASAAAARTRDSAAATHSGLSGAPKRR